MSVDAYSPFDKPLQHLEAADLAILQTTHEGWYVEYKAEIASASSIAKSISAFSNTYGGWLFYGIQEKSKDETIAGQFPGIARSDVDVANQRIRQAAASHIAPSPYFNIKIIWGPCEEIRLQ